MTGHGGPWLLAAKPGGCFHGFQWYPVGLHAHLLMQYSGNATVVAWPGSAVLQRGGNLDDQWNFLFSDLPPKAFEKFGQDNIIYQTLGEGDMAWIPFGWQAMIFGRPADRLPKTSMQPFLNTAWEVKDTSHRFYVWHHTRRMLARSIKDNWAGFGQAAHDWEEDLKATMDKVTADIEARQEEEHNRARAFMATPVQPHAIEDGLATSPAKPRTGQGVEDVPLAAGGVALTQLDDPGTAEEGNSKNGQEDPESKKVSREDLISRSGSPVREPADLD